MGLMVGLGVLAQISLAQSPPTNTAPDPIQQRLKVLEESYLPPLKEIPGDTSQFKAMYPLRLSREGLRDLISIPLPRITCQYQSTHQLHGKPRQDLIKVALFPII